MPTVTQAKSNRSQKRTSEKVEHASGLVAAQPHRVHDEPVGVACHTGTPTALYQV